MSIALHFCHSLVWVFCLLFVVLFVCLIVCLSVCPLLLLSVSAFNEQRPLKKEKEKKVSLQ